MKWQKTNYGYFRKVFMTTENAQGKFCKTQYIKIKPNTTVRPHYHKGQEEAEYVLKGTGSVKSGKQVIKLKQGVLFIVKPNEWHEVKAGKQGLLLFVTKANFSEDTEWRE